jgi:chromosomal replication initiator protein
LHPGKNKEKIDFIMQVVADAFALSPDDLRRSTKTPKYAAPRQIAIYLVGQLTGASALEIAYHFQKHHTTVTHAISIIEEQRRRGGEIGATVDELLREIARR